MASFTVVWVFLVIAGKEQRFEEIYGPEGDWAQLFHKAEGYIRTELLQDPGNPRRYLTLDFWTSREAYESFRERHLTEYESLDAQCQGLTEQEQEIGSFEGVGRANG
jgi:heme-degrading monooxygenase HmoA